MATTMLSLRRLVLIEGFDWLIDGNVQKCRKVMNKMWNKQSIHNKVIDIIRLETNEENHGLLIPHMRRPWTKSFQRFLHLYLCLDIPDHPVLPAEKLWLHIFRLILFYQLTFSSATPASDRCSRHQHVPLPKMLYKPEDILQIWRY